MNRVLIDIVIPTYNRAGQLRHAIDSVFAQTFPGFSLYVLDNCSDDDTSEICASYEDQGLAYLRNPVNCGMVGNWNRALSVGDSQYLLILHDDDALAPEFLETIMPVIASAGAFSFLHSAATIIDRDGARMSDRILDLPTEMPGTEFFTRFLGGKMSVICPSVIYNRRVIPQTHRFQEELSFTADLFYFIGASEFGPVLYSDKPYFRYRVHEASTTSSLVKAIDRKIADRVHASKYLQTQADRRDVPSELRDTAGKSYRLAALSADVWFTRRLGGSYSDVGHVVWKIVAAEPGLLIHVGFYTKLMMALLPSAAINGLAMMKRSLVSRRRTS